MAVGHDEPSHSQGGHHPLEQRLAYLLRATLCVIGPAEERDVHVGRLRHPLQRVIDDVTIYQHPLRRVLVGVVVHHRVPLLKVFDEFAVHRRPL
jgi:hypothetical protein